MHRSRTRETAGMVSRKSLQKLDPRQDALYYRPEESREGSVDFLEKSHPGSTNLESARLKIDIETKFNLI